MLDLFAAPDALPDSMQLQPTDLTLNSAGYSLIGTAFASSKNLSASWIAFCNVSALMF
jgi:hypothetical protein